MEILFYFTLKYFSFLKILLTERVENVTKDTSTHNSKCNRMSQNV